MEMSSAKEGSGSLMREELRRRQIHHELPMLTLCTLTLGSSPRRLISVHVIVRMYFQRRNFTVLKHQYKSMLEGCFFGVNMDRAFDQLAKDPSNTSQKRPAILREKLVVICPDLTVPLYTFSHPHQYPLRAPVDPIQHSSLL